MHACLESFQGLQVVTVNIDRIAGKAGGSVSICLHEGVTHRCDRVTGRIRVLSENGHSQDEFSPHQGWDWLDWFSFVV